MADIGTAFQPGQDDPKQRGANQARQEAVRILSLRLPKVLGGSAMAPAPLLSGLGSGGSPFANSAVGQSLQRAMPTQEPPQPVTMGMGGPSISGAAGGPVMGQEAPPSWFQQQMNAAPGQGSAPPPNFKTILPGDQPPFPIPQAPPPPPPSVNLPENWMGQNVPGGGFTGGIPQAQGGEPTSAPTPSPAPLNSQPDTSWIQELLKRKFENDGTGNNFLG